MSVVPGPFKSRVPNRPTGGLGAFSPANWQGKTPPGQDWMVDGAFMRGTVAMLSGDGGLGKSLLCQQLCTAAALGKDWLGLWTRPARSLAVFCEDDRDELHRRQAKINKFYGCDMGDLGDMLVDARPGQESVLVKFERFGSAPVVTPLYHEIREQAKDLGAGIIVLDTRRDIFRGNEIDFQQANQTIRLLRQLALEIQGVVILTDHPSNEGLSSGSGISGNRAWSNSVRSRLYLTRPPTAKGEQDRPDDRILKTMKNNAGRLGGYPLVWRDGVFVRLDAPAPRHDQIEDDALPF